MTSQNVISIVVTPVSNQDKTFQFEVKVSDNRKVFAAEWDFGDGNKNEEKTPTHTYALEKEYTVSVQTELMGPRPDGEQIPKKKDKRPGTTTVVSTYS